MHSDETKEKFIQLRAAGKTFDQIAAELDVGRSTLFEWAGEMNKMIQKQRLFEYEKLAGEYHLTRYEALKAGLFPD